MLRTSTMIDGFESSARVFEYLLHSFLQRMGWRGRQDIFRSYSKRSWERAAPIIALKNLSTSKKDVRFSKVVGERIY